MTVIVDYGLGNRGSIFNMLLRIGATAKVSALAADIESADRLILPGVGSFDRGMTQLRDLGLEAPLRAAVGKGTPLLGICLGAQMLLDGSEEGNEPGLGLIPGRVVRFKDEWNGAKLRIPHMGWNEVQPQSGTGLFHGLMDEARFYFVHSYHFAPTYEAHTMATTQYGGTFASAIGHNNVAGVQFHPEKSHRFGMALLTNFTQA